MSQNIKSENLGLHIQQLNERQCQYSVAVGDITLVGADNKNKKLTDQSLITICHRTYSWQRWKVCLLKLQVSHSQILQPYQRIYSLEVSLSCCTKSIFLKPTLNKIQVEVRKGQAIFTC